MRPAACLVVLLMLPAGAGGQPAPLGKLIDLGGYRLHLYCTGQGKGTVVLSPGGGDYSFDWHLVQQKASAFARVCSYDRAASAWSDPGPEPRTMRQEAHELRTALQRAKEREPFVLVGHSLGGLVMRIFAERYPDVAGGLVLVDATSPDTTLSVNGKLVRMRDLAQARPVPGVQTMSTSPPQPRGQEERRQAADTRQKSGERKIQPPYDRLPVTIQQLQLWAWSLPPPAARGEDYLPEELNELYQHSRAVAHPLGDRPLITIVALRSSPAPPGASKEQWDALLQEKIAQKRDYRKLSTNSKVVEDPRAGHHVHLENPETVVTAIREILNAVHDHVPFHRERR